MSKKPHNYRAKKLAARHQAHNVKEHRRAERAAASEQKKAAAELARMEQERLRVRGVLRGASLPNDMPIDFQSVPDDTDGAFFPRLGTLAVRFGAPDSTIVHEGAHAEHYRRAGISTSSWPEDDDAQVGMRLASEAYVGWRLARREGFLADERTAISKIGDKGFPATIGAWATLYQDTADIRGPRFDGTLMSSDGFRILMRILPAVVAERTIGDVQLAADLDQTVAMPGDVLRSVAAKVVHLADVETDLIDLAKMRALGAAVKAEFRSHGVF
ncbi:hypothetical protein WME75_38395 [Sorangium sp. So ce1014]|uniref:hypothetical protein n=1 Tax=Sorangium sp. So ce1014 TaxID=3133326 RepID=UPI003F60E599